MFQGYVNIYLSNNLGEGHPKCSSSLDVMGSTKPHVVQMMGWGWETGSSQNLCSASP